MIIICPNLANPEVKQEFDELISVLGEKAAYAVWALNDGNMIDRAPNGAPSIMFQSLLSKNKNDRTAAIREKAEIYKKSFNSWFTKLGDEAKELFTDANGEPLTEVLDKNFSSIYDILVGKQDPVVDLNKTSLEESYILENAPRDSKGRLLAPNGRPSNLPERLYAQVRTKEFKDWFGDWEKVAYSSKYRESHDIPNSITSAIYKGVGVSEAMFDPDMAPDGGKRLIFLDKDDTLIGEIPVIESKDKIRMSGSVGTATEIEEEYRGKGYGKKAHLALANIAKSEGKVLYSDKSNSDAEDALWKSLVKDGIAEVVSESPKVGHWNHTVYRIINDKLPQADDINSGDRNVSKVVDENGEPRVVYHGSKSIFNVFDSSKSESRQSLSKQIKPTNFFSSDETVADFFALTENQSIDKYKYNVFLNMKSPIILDAKGERADSFIEANKEVLDNNDEVIIININETVGNKDTATDYFVRNSNQIKSATGNIGTFSNTEYDINARIDTNSKLINAIASTHRQLKQIPKKVNTTRYGGDNIYYQLRKALPKEIVEDIVKFYYEEKDRDSFLDRVEFYINNELKQSVMPKVIAAAKERQLELSTHYDARQITA